MARQEKRQHINVSIAALKQTAEETAKEKGLLERAEENARTLVQSYIEKTYDPDEYKIEFE